jgi:hypothetical protein
VKKDDTLQLFVKISLHHMYDHYLPKLLYTLQTLEMEEFWMRETKETNSIGGIVLHICEYIRRNTLQYSDSSIIFQKELKSISQMLIGQRMNYANMFKKHSINGELRW